jgi:hypothetical protein
MLGVQCGKGEMVGEYCGVDEAIQHAYPVTQMEAFKPCQGRAGNVLFPPEQVREDGRFDQTIKAGHYGGFPNDGEAVTQM